MTFVFQYGIHEIPVMLSIVTIRINTEFIYLSGCIYMSPVTYVRHLYIDYLTNVTENNITEGSI
jgi:hypothetical protein